MLIDSSFFICFLFIRSEDIRTCMSSKNHPKIGSLGPHNYILGELAHLQTRGKVS